MKKLTLKAIAGCLLAGSAMFAGSVMATPVITNSAGSFGNWGGFDWASNGSAAVDNFNPFVLNNNFNLTYWAEAASLFNTSGGTAGFAVANGGIVFDNYEYTIKLTLNEVSTCTAFLGPLGSCSTATFNVISGAFSIYYDTSANANQVTGAGITDGALLLSGTVLPSTGGGFNIVSGGNATLNGVVTYTNNLYINPDLANTIATSTLQLGGNITAWLPPTGLPGAGGGSLALFPGDPLLGQFPVYFQADANQTFTATVPEPGSLALIGLSLAGLAFVRRRKSV